MASNETVKPKGILKHSSSLDHRDSVSHKEMTWDEMNILATHHPADKDYGHMKIDEPPTPYSKLSDVEDEVGEETRRGSVGEKPEMDPNALASRLKDVDAKSLRHARVAAENDDDDEDDDDEDEDEEQKEQRHNFELKRKLHYNEYQAVQLAKKLMSEEEDEDEEENDTNSSSNKMDLSSPTSSDKLS